MNRPQPAEPRISIFCRCGAQWHGKYAVKNPVIDAHGKRCGDPIAPAVFEGLRFTIKYPTRAAWKAGR